MSANIHDLQTVNMTSDIHDLAFAGSGFQLSADGGNVLNWFDFTGIDPSGIAIGGQEIALINIGSEPITLKHNDTRSATGNRFFFSDGLDHNLNPEEIVWGIYIESVPGRVGWWLQF